MRSAKRRDNRVAVRIRKAVFIQRPRNCPFNASFIICQFGFADKNAEIPTSSRIREVKADATALDDLPTYQLQLPAEGIWIVKLLADSGLCKSNGDARRLVQGGGAYWGEKRIESVDFTVSAADFANGPVILKAGKKNFKRIVLS